MSRKVEERPCDSCDGNAPKFVALPEQARAVKHENAAVPSRSSVAGACDGLELSRGRPELPRGRRADMAQERSRRRQRRAHPATPVVVQNRRHRKDALFDDYELPCRHPMPYRVRCDSHPNELGSRRTVELILEQIGESNVPHYAL